MRFGFVNNPALDPAAELAAGAADGFDYVDFTLEYPRASRESLEARELAALLRKHRLGIVGHTAYYYPLDLPWPALRRAVAEEVARDLEFFAAAGARKATLHFQPSVPLRMFSPARLFVFWRDTLGRLAPVARKAGIVILLENCQYLQGSPLFARVLGAFPDIRFHLDVGHANLAAGGDLTRVLLRRFGRKLAHLHLSDNVGGPQDLHLPLGAGQIDWPEALRAIGRAGYDDTATLEVFSRERSYRRRSLEIARDLVRRLKAEARRR